MKIGPETPPTAEDQAFVDAAGRGDLEAVQAALFSGTDPDVLARRGSEWNVTALMAAAEKGQAEVVRSLLRAGADPNRYNSDVPFGDGNYTALQMAMLAKKWDTARILVEAGAKLTSKSGRPSPLETAVNARRNDLVLLLLERGANPNKKGTMGQTPLHEAANSGDIELVNAILAAGANVNVANEVGGTPLMEAARYGHDQVVRRLIEAGADLAAVRTAAFKGATALMLAAAFGKDEVVGVLLDAGADPLVAEADGKTAIDIALQRGHAAVVERLRAGGAKAGKTDTTPAPERLPRGIDRPDFRESSTQPDFRLCASRLAEICGTTAEPFDDLGGVACSVPQGKAGGAVNAHQKEFLERGCFLFWTHMAGLASANPEQVVLLPTTDQFAAVAFLQTNGINYDLGPGDIVDGLMEIHHEMPLILTEVGNDRLGGRFTGPIENSRALARRLYELCPDIVDQGAGSLPVLAASLTKSPEFFLWWD
jgi:ankyrin repeat protein